MIKGNNNYRKNDNINKIIKIVIIVILIVITL